MKGFGKDAELLLNDTIIWQSGLMAPLAFGYKILQGIVNQV